MAEQTSEQTVKAMFAAFQQGDIQSVLSLMAEDVEWRLGGPTEVVSPGTRRGRDKLGEFFRKLGEASEFELFEAREYITQGERVVALGHERQRIRATGRVSEVDWAMVFTVRDGKITHFRNYEDTAVGAKPQPGA